MIKRLAAIFAALGMTLLLAVPALANELHQTIPQGGIPYDSAGYAPETGDCVGVAPGTVLWHFVHTDTTSGNLPSTLTVTFSNNTSQTVNGYTNGSSIVMYDVTTATGVSLLSAVDTIENTATGGLLNLSHICNSGPPPQVPEAPLTVLLVLTAGLTGLGFVGWRMRQNRTIA